VSIALLGLGGVAFGQVGVGTDRNTGQPRNQQQQQQQPPSNPRPNPGDQRVPLPSPDQRVPLPGSRPGPSPSGSGSTGSGNTRGNDNGIAPGRDADRGGSNDDRRDDRPGRDRWRGRPGYPGYYNYWGYDRYRYYDDGYRPYDNGYRPYEPQTYPPDAPPTEPPAAPAADRGNDPRNRDPLLPPDDLMGDEDTPPAVQKALDASPQYREATAQLLRAWAEYARAAEQVMQRLRATPRYQRAAAALREAEAKVAATREQKAPAVNLVTAAQNAMLARRAVRAMEQQAINADPLAKRAKDQVDQAVDRRNKIRDDIASKLQGEAKPEAGQ
jgi:hypothetical protein